MLRLIERVILAVLSIQFNMAVCLADSNAKEVITLAGIEEYEPLSYKGKNKPEGFYNDIMRELFSRAGYSLKVKLMPFRRVLEMTRAGAVTGMIGVYFSPERGEFATYLRDVPLTKLSQFLFLNKDSSVSSPDPMKLKGKRIAHKRGFIMSPEFDLAAKSGVFRSLELESPEQMVKMMLSGRIDGFVHVPAHTFYYINKFDKQKSSKTL